MTAAMLVLLALLVVCMVAVLRDALQALREGDSLAEAEAKWLADAEREAGARRGIPRLNG